MTLKLKLLMKDLLFLNEAELYCSNMEYRVVDGIIKDKIIGDGSTNAADLQTMCQDRIQQITKQYREEFKEVTALIKAQENIAESNAKAFVARTVYLAAYFHPLNLDC